MTAAVGCSDCDIVWGRNKKQLYCWALLDFVSALRGYDFNTRSFSIPDVHGALLKAQNSARGEGFLSRMAWLVAADRVWQVDCRKMSPSREPWKRQGAPGTGSQSCHCFPLLLLIFFKKTRPSFIAMFEILNGAPDPISRFCTENNLQKLEISDK